MGDLFRYRLCRRHGQILEERTDTHTLCAQFEAITKEKFIFFRFFYKRETNGFYSIQKSVKPSTMGKKDEAKQDLTKEVEMTEHQDSIEKVCETYGVKPDQGLSDAEAQKRIERDGYNELTPPKVTFTRSRDGSDFSFFLFRPPQNGLNSAKIFLAVSPPSCGSVRSCVSLPIQLNPSPTRTQSRITCTWVLSCLLSLLSLVASNTSKRPNHQRLWSHSRTWSLNKPLSCVMVK